MHHGPLLKLNLFGTILGCLLAVSIPLQLALHQAHAQSPALLIADPIKTDAGLISGTTIGEPGKQVRIFRGIPYAAPPVGKLRWAEPQPVTPWTGIRETTKFAPWCTQNYPNMAWMGGITEFQMSEDCLYLNVLTPAKAATDKLPVMVWIHPGGLDAGGGNQRMFNTPYLPLHGVVLVNLVSRIGGMGYLAPSGAAADSPHHAAGNYGMLDLIAALKWVKTNIAAFGGDPDCVTIFGQSGGGGKVFWLMASPMAKGLFHRAIAESGFAAVADELGGPNGPVMSQTEANRMADKLAKSLGANSIDEFRKIPWEILIKALPAPQHANEFNVRSVVDGWSMPDTPFNTFAKGLGSDVPFMVGAGEGEQWERRRAITLWSPALLNRKAPTYAYIFAHVPSNWRKQGLMAYHGIELNYQFGDLKTNLDNDWGNLLPTSYSKDPGIDQDDFTVSENTMRMWVQFAKTGNPSLPGLIDAEPLKPGPGGDRFINITVKPQMNSGFFLGEPTLKRQIPLGESAPAK